MAARLPAASTSTSKKFVLKPYKPTASIDLPRAVEMWEHLRQAIIKIQDRCSENLSFEELYRLSYNLVLHKHGELLYSGVSAVVKDHLSAQVEQLVKCSDEVLLRELESMWSEHKQDMAMIRDVLMYMDRTYVPTQKKLLIYDKGTTIFKEVVLQHPRIGMRVRNLLLDAFSRERAFEMVDRPRIRNILVMLVDLGVNSTAIYEEEFELPFLEATAEFYREESGVQLSRQSAAEYLRYAEQRIREERDRCLTLHLSTRSKLMEIVHFQLVAEHAIQLIEMENSGLIYLLSASESSSSSSSSAMMAGGTGGSASLYPSSASAAGVGSSASSSFQAGDTGGGVRGGTVASALRGGGGAAVDDRRLGDLRRMYVLFQAVRTGLAWRPTFGDAAGKERILTPIAILRDSMKALVMVQGRAVVGDAEARKDPVGFVQALLDIRERFATVVDVAFGGDKDFHRALKEAFENVTNEPTDASSNRPSGAGKNVCAEYLSIYVDEHMRTLFRDAQEDEIDAKLTKVVTIFRFLHDKDVFENYYKSHLQRRLLGGKSANDDAERQMISKLKAECGLQYTSKLEGMFNDLRTSAEFMKAYRGVRGPVPAGQVELDVTVLTSGFWPSVSEPACALPLEVASSADTFRSYYLSRHSGRRLTWYTGKGTVDIRARIGASPKGHELTVSTYQMCVLLLFNDGESVSFRRMREMLGREVRVEELKRHVLSLTAPKAKVLLKGNTKSKDIEDAEEFTVNAAFDSKMYKVRIPLISAKSAAAAAAASSGASSGARGASGAGGGDPDGDDGVPEQVEEARKSLLEAAIVRIMKTRKTLDFNALVGEVAKMVSARFQPLPADIKKRVESLIEREYIARDKDSKTVLHYES